MELSWATFTSSGGVKYVRMCSQRSRGNAPKGEPDRLCIGRETEDGDARTTGGLLYPVAWEWWLKGLETWTAAWRAIIWDPVYQGRARHSIGWLSACQCGRHLMGHRLVCIRICNKEPLLCVFWLPRVQQWRWCPECMSRAHHESATNLKFCFRLRKRSDNPDTRDNLVTRVDREMVKYMLLHYTISRSNANPRNP